MRLLITVAILVLHFDLFGQEIAECIEVLGTDSLKYYFKHGRLTSKECSDFYRLAKVDHDYYFFDGHSQDYFLEGQLAVDCYYVDGLLHGRYSSFYSNGQIRETGQFAKGQKIGEWECWYKNGQLKKRIIFKEVGYSLQEFYKSNGKQLVAGGNGKFIGDDSPSMTIIGEIKNGQQHGKWKILNKLSGLKTAEECFENGKFIEGVNIAQVQSFNGKYFDFPTSTIDLTQDLLPLYSEKGDCINQIGESHAYQSKRYNDQYTDLPFFDYVYQNFDAPQLSKGYILAGFTIDTSGKLTDISIQSTLDNASVDDLLRTVLNSAQKWEPRRHNGWAIESTELLVFQFINGTYRILGDGRNSHPPVSYSAEFMYGIDSLKDYVEKRTKLPIHFFDKEVSIAATLNFHIDEDGTCIDDNNGVIYLLRITDDERILYHEVLTMLKNTSKKWKPATCDGRLAKHYFTGVFTIREGIPKFRLFSNTLVSK